MTDRASASHRSDQTLRAIMEGSTDVITRFAPDLRRVYVNPAAEAVYGCPAEELIGLMPGESGESPNVTKLKLDAIRQVFRDGKPTVIEFPHATGDSRGWWSSRLTPEFGDDGTVQYVIMASRDVTDSVRAEQKIRESETRFRSAFENATIGMAIQAGAEGRFLQVNRALCVLLGRPERELLSLTSADLAHPDDRGESRKVARSVERGDMNTYRSERRYLTPDGATVWANVSLSVVDGPDGAAVYVITQFEDITDRKRAEEQLAHQALHDALTGLPNRQLMRDRVSQAIRRLHRSTDYIALLSVDLDRFKVVNESLGYQTGDSILNDVAKRLMSVLRTGDTLARFGGDEFFVLCEDLGDVADAERVAERVAGCLDAPFQVNDKSLHITASIGVAVTSDVDGSPDTLIAEADLAMYQAKERGRGRHVTLQEPLRDQVIARLDLELDMRKALDAEGFHVVYQPVFALGETCSDDRIVGAEALLRWKHPERGHLSPDQFIAVAEDSGLIVPIGEWVLGEACRKLREWNDGRAGDERLWVSVNLSARQLGHEDIVGAVRSVVDTWGVRPSELHLEITETAIMREPQAAADAIAALSDLGVRISLDDFGTGYSSLGHLRLFPVDTVKIDRSFVKDIDRSRSDRAIVAAVATMTREMSMGTVAEGVETEGELETARRLGIEHVQGYFFSKPLLPEDFQEFLARGSASA